MSKTLNVYSLLRRMKIDGLPSTLLLTGPLVDLLDEHVKRDASGERSLSASVHLVQDEDLIRASLGQADNLPRFGSRPASQAHLFLHFNDDGDAIHVMGVLGDDNMTEVEHSHGALSLTAGRYKGSVDVALFICPPQERAE